MTSSALTVSVLDLIPVRTGQSTSQAIQAARRLVHAAEAAGAHRYWVAEHHNTSSVASTSPPVLIALLGEGTERIRLGSGGVMLPNHSPLAVAEQFAALEAAYPERIDLGIGRAPGTDPVTSWALRNGANDEEIVQQFPTYVQRVMAFMSPGGARMLVGDRPFDISATPRATSAPPVWLLGSSDYSARLAAQLGLPYVF
ncbi:MAG: MsnO8 family LLM class oxidoreductase, partial [Propionibacteriaceae bacterium]|nr:MsnO8 family LLM class oxidoreductase [Propionibacteriaceae bacterium]